VPVFPGEQVTWFSPEAEKELFRNTMRQIRHSGINATIMLSVAKARLSMPEALDEARSYYKQLEQPNGQFFVPSCGYFMTETMGVAAMISEFLMQSVDNTIRVFPCWPKDKDASFTNLRAQGGFLVTAEQNAGKVTKLEVHSTVGGKLRLLNPWTDKIVEYQTQQDEKLDLKP
jgi:alpha-L-fucosidase 2